MRKKITKIIHLFATTQKDYNLDEKGIKRDRALKPEEVERLKDPKKKNMRVRTVQKVISANVIERNLKKLWNDTPAPDRPKMEALMLKQLKAKGLWNEPKVQSEKDSSGSPVQSGKVRQEESVEQRA